MAKVGADNLTHFHTRAGRALLQWSTADLAEKAGSTAANVRKFEAGRNVSEGVRQALVDALEDAGIELLNGKRPGARYKSAPSSE